MSKETLKKKKNNKQKDNILPKIKTTTIRSDILFVMFITIFLVILVIFTYCIYIINSAENNLSSSFIKNLSVFNPMQTSEQFESQFPEITKKINDMIPSEYSIKGIFIVDNNTKQRLYTSLNETQYEYIPNTPSPFKIKLKDKKSEYKTISFSKKFSDKTYDLYMITTNESQSIKQITQMAFMFFIILIALCFILTFVLANGISKPLLKMNETVSKIGTGDLSGRLEYTKYEEINQLVQSYNMMVNSLQKMYSSLEMEVQDRTKELKNAYAELQNTQAMMVHSEKMKSLGELVAGIMHEINNPINFIYGNMTHLSNYSSDLIQIIEEYTKYNNSLKPNEKEEIEKLKQDIDYDFLKSDLPDLIKSCKEGADRAKNIIQDLKSFSRMEEATIVDVDIPHEIDTTLNILHNKLKNKAEIHKEYMENIPKIEAFGGQLNQVFMNILDNAAGAIKDKGDIWIRLNTDKNKSKLIIEIEDNGIGMNEETARKVFDPFFTTKPVGQGTGLGMSITHKIIKNHQGDIKIDSHPGIGTKFIITLPVNIDRENLNASLVSGETNG